MKKTYIILIVIQALFFACALTSCNPDDEMDQMIQQQDEEEEPEPVEVNPPCLPDTNSLTFSNFPVNFYSTTANVTPGALNWGNWGCFANSTDGDLNIEFGNEPVTGHYITQVETPSLAPNEVVLYGTFANHHWVATAGDTLFVTVENGNFNATFCEFDFNSPTTDLWPFITDGNLNDDY